MWASAQAADTQTAWQQVTAWRRTHDLLLHHAGRLKACADELSYAWPPGKSPAAQAFVEYLNNLRETILKASADAATNYTAIAGVLTSLSAAKADMAKLKQEWDSHQSDHTAVKTQSSTTSGERREALNARARSRMAQNDQEVLESSRRFVDLKSTSEQGVLLPYPPGGGSNDGSGSGGSQSTRIAGGTPTARMTAPSVSSVDAIDGQIGLAGSLGTSKPAGGADASALGVTPGASPARDVQFPPAGVAAVGTVPVPRGPSTGAPTQAARPWSTHPGSAAGVGGAAPASPTAVGAGRGHGKVNPVGGVIEANRSAASTPGLLPFMGGARGLGGGHRDSTANPTMCWEVPVGGSPVIEPQPEPRFELGPGVIGIDR